MKNYQELTKDDILKLGTVYLGSIIAFQVIYELSYHYFEKKSIGIMNSKSVLFGYRVWTPQKKADFISRITSQIHAFVAIIVALKALFYTCVDSPQSETSNSQYASFFSSDYCLMQHFDVIQMMTLSITAGYLTFDIYICYARIQEKSKLQTQTYIHHVIVISGFLSSIFYGRGGALIISNVLLINEFSTFFLNYRHLLFVFNRQMSPWYKWNALLFFLSFFFSRIVFNSLVSYYVARAYYLTTKDLELSSDDVPFWQVFLGLYLIALFAIFYILNLFWFIGIVKHLKRSMTKKKSESQEQPSSGQAGGNLSGQDEEGKRLIEAKKEDYQTIEEEIKREEEGTE